MRRPTVSDVARRLGAEPKHISQLFYERALRDDLAPIVGGRRRIDESLIPMIVMQLRRRGMPCRNVPARPAKAVANA